MAIDDNTLHKAAGEMYPKIKELADRYGINFQADDMFIISFIRLALKYRYNYNYSKLSGQEIYNEVQADISRGLVYVIKIVERLLQEDPLTTPLLNLKQVTYHTKYDDGNTYLGLCFKNFWALLRIIGNGIIVRWSIGKDLDFSVIDRMSLLAHDESNTALTQSVKSDLN